LATLLKIAAASGIATMVDTASIIAEARSSTAIGSNSQADTNTAGVEVPPSLMLHARSVHLQLLKPLLDKLTAHNFHSVTYKDLLAAVQGTQPLPDNPVILSFDDMTCAISSQNVGFPTFQFMENILLNNGFKGVFGLITEPILEPRQAIIQDMAHWQVVAGWIQDGMEIATHTKNHIDLIDRALTLSAIREQIQDSTFMIAEATGQPVTTLILPFGNGLTGKMDAVAHEKIRPEIKQVCQELGIQMVVGLSEGRGIVGPDNANNNSDVWYVGRTVPGLTDEMTNPETAFNNLLDFKQGNSLTTAME